MTAPRQREDLDFEAAQEEIAYCLRMLAEWVPEGRSYRNVIEGVVKFARREDLRSEAVTDIAWALGMFVEAGPLEMLPDVSKGLAALEKHKDLEFEDLRLIASGFARIAEQALAERASIEMLTDAGKSLARFVEGEAEADQVIHEALALAIQKTSDIEASLEKQLPPEDVGAWAHFCSRPRAQQIGYLRETEEKEGRKLLPDGIPEDLRKLACFRLTLSPSREASPVRTSSVSRC
jgi:hypothetical protein